VSKLALIVELGTRPSRDLEDCLDLAVRKGKAGGEPKPTEKKDDVGPTPPSRRLKQIEKSPGRTIFHIGNYK